MFYKEWEYLHLETAIIFGRYLCNASQIFALLTLTLSLALAFFPLEGQDMRLGSKKKQHGWTRILFSLKYFIDIKLKRATNKEILFPSLFDLCGNEFKFYS